MNAGYESIPANGMSCMDCDGLFGSGAGASSQDETAAAAAAGGSTPAGVSAAAAKPKDAAKSDAEACAAGVPLQPPGHQTAAPSDRPWVDLSRIGPLALALEEVVEGEGGGRVQALLAVMPGRSTVANTGGLYPVDGWPIRCAAASAGLRRCLLALHSYQTPLRVIVVGWRYPTLALGYFILPYFTLPIPNQTSDVLWAPAGR